MTPRGLGLLTAYGKTGTTPTAVIPISPELILDVHEIGDPSSRGAVNLAFCSEVLCPVPGGDCVVRLDGPTFPVSVVPDPWQNGRVADYVAAHFVRIGFHFFNPALVIRAQVLGSDPFVVAVETEHCRRQTVEWQVSPSQFQTLIRRAGLVATGHDGCFVSLGHTLLYDRSAYQGSIRQRGGTDRFSVFPAQNDTIIGLVEALDWIPAGRGLLINPAHCKLISEARVFLSTHEGFYLDDVTLLGLDRFLDLPWMEAAPHVQVNLLAVNVYSPLIEDVAYPNVQGLHLGERELVIWIPRDRAGAIVEAALSAQGFPADEAGD